MSEFRRRLMCYEGNGTPPAPSYIQQDLIFQLDGLEKGNITNAWTDLINGYSFTGNAIELSNGWDFNGAQYLRCNGYDGISQLNGNHIWTFEIALHSKSPSSWGSIFNTYWNYNSRKKHINVNNGIYGNKLSLKSGSSDIHDGKNLYCAIIDKNSDSVWSSYCNSPESILNLNLINGIIISGQGLNGNGGNMCIGARNVDNWSGYLNMTIYAIRIYNRQLTFNEILYNQQLDIQRFNLSI